MKVTTKIRNMLNKLLGVDIIELEWVGDLDVLKVLHRYKIDAEYTLDSENPPEGKVVANLYINKLGGFIPYNTKLFIYQNKIYRK